MPVNKAERQCKAALGVFLREAREKKGVTIGAIATAIDRSKTYVCDVEAGRRGGSKMPAEIVSMWASYLDIHVSTIAKLQWPDGIRPSDTVSSHKRFVSYMRILRNRTRSQRIYKAVREMRTLLKESSEDLTPAQTKDLLSKMSENVEVIDTCLAYA